MSFSIWSKKFWYWPSEVGLEMVTNGVGGEAGMVGWGNREAVGCERVRNMGKMKLTISKRPTISPSFLSSLTLGSALGRG